MHTWYIPSIYQVYTYLCSYTWYIPGIYYRSTVYTPCIYQHVIMHTWLSQVFAVCTMPAILPLVRPTLQTRCLTCAMKGISKFPILGLCLMSLCPKCRNQWTMNTGLCPTSLRQFPIQVVMQGPVHLLCQMLGRMG